MNWTIDEIIDTPFLYEETLSESRNLSGYHLFTRVTNAIRRRNMPHVADNYARERFNCLGEKII